MTRPGRSTNERVSLGLTIIITVAWAVSFIVDILRTEYEPPASVHALMLIVAGAVFGDGLVRSNRIAVKRREESKEEDDA